MPSITQPVSGPAQGPHLHLRSRACGMCTLQDSFHLSRNLCPSHLPPLPKESSQGQGTFQPSSVCPACLGDDKKQFIMSLHCEVIRNQWRFPSSLGFPLSDNSMGGFALGPCLPHLLSDFPSLSVSFPPSLGGPGNEMSNGQAGQRASCVWTQLSPNYLSRWMEPGRSFINATQSQPGPQAWESTCLSLFPHPPPPPPTLTSPPHPLRNPRQPK